MPSSVVRAERRRTYDYYHVEVLYSLGVSASLPPLSVVASLGLVLLSCGGVWDFLGCPPNTRRARFWAVGRKQAAPRDVR